MTAPRTISSIMADVKKAWAKPNFAAVPYIAALSTLRTVNDVYIHEDARSLILYFLSNASSFRGPQAKALKAELRALL